MNFKAILGIVLACILVLGTGVGGCSAWNEYRVYSAQQSGKAVLAEAESSRQVKTLEARATMESAKMLAEAEIIRATGAAKANHILQNSLGGPAGYLRYLQIQALENTKANLVYVPTESGLPVTEATRLQQTVTPNVPE